MNVFNIIKLAIWGISEAKADQEDFDEMMIHGIAALPALTLNDLSLSEDLLEKWNSAILQQLSYYARYRYAQSRLALGVPYIILKGTAAAQYYPHPEHRTMGDIDIITKREDFDKAYRYLLDIGYQITKITERETVFVKNGIAIELHRYFASLNDPKQCKYLDDLIIDNINSSHMLPDLVNGLVILEHIGQHLEHGLGLRQIIDWMMFVDKCLPDENWMDFRSLAQVIGLEQLAKTMTRMCELYLGLPERQWCADVDHNLCELMMNYILSSGNFGNKWTSSEAVSQTVFTYTRGPVATFKWLQQRGLVNWKAAQKYKILRPFAWIYQGIRYIILGVSQEGSFSIIRQEYEEAKKRTDLFEALGVKQKSKGLVTYRNGEYVKR